MSLVQRWLAGACCRNPACLWLLLTLSFSPPHFLSSAGFQTHHGDHQLNSWCRMVIWLTLLCSDSCLLVCVFCPECTKMIFFFLNKYLSSHPGWTEDDGKLPEGLTAPFVFWSSKCRFCFTGWAFFLCAWLLHSALDVKLPFFFVDIWQGASLCPAKRIVYSGQSVILCRIYPPLEMCFGNILKSLKSFLLSSSFTLLNL